MEYRTLPGFSKYRIYEDGSIVKTSGLVLKPSIGDNGYYLVRMTGDDHSVLRAGLHRIVATAFHGFDLQRPDLEPDHKDMNPANNHKDNLEIVTKSENIRRANGRDPHSSTDEAKQCATCHQHKSRDKFWALNRSADGLRSSCIECCKEYRRNRYPLGN